MMGLGLGLSLGSGAARFNPASLFTGGVKGLIWDFSVSGSLYSDAGVTPAALDGPIGRVIDQSGNGVTGNQTTAASKPLWKTSGGKFFALFDGSNDFLETAAVNFAGSHNITVVAGVRKLSDAASGMIVESSATAVSNAGAFAVQGPNGPNPNYLARSRGATTERTTAATPFTSPITSVVTMLGDTVVGVSTLRVNGVFQNNNNGAQGGGDYGNYPIYCGMRAGSSLPFNGQIFALVIVGRELTAAELTSLETWVNARTGAY